MVKDVTLLSAQDVLKTLRRYDIREVTAIVDGYLTGKPLDTHIDIRPIEHMMLMDLRYRYILARNGKNVQYHTLEVTMPFVRTIVWTDLDV